MDLQQAALDLGTGVSEIDRRLNDSEGRRTNGRALNENAKGAREKPRKKDVAKRLRESGRRMPNAERPSPKSSSANYAPDCRNRIADVAPILNAKRTNGDGSNWNVIGKPAYNVIFKQGVEHSPHFGRA
ncbi:MAG: hypothetical protein ABI432_16830 [Flavobacteriales bacterium]